jgi:DNA-binding phage protein
MATSQYADLLETLIQAARSQGISQGELAARVGIRAETLSRAKKNPVISLKTFLDLVRVAGLRVQLVPDHPVAEQITSGTLFPGSNSKL